MSLADIAAALTHGQVTNLANLILSLVHAIIDALEDLRGNHDATQAALSEQIRLLEDRTNNNLAAVRADLITKADHTAARIAVLEQLKDHASAKPPTTEA